MISWLLIIELAGLTYCIGRAADHLGQVHVPDQIKEAAFISRSPSSALPWCSSRLRKKDRFSFDSGVG